jgi:hypothetical protein
MGACPRGRISLRSPTREEMRMPAIAFTVPVLPGKETLDRSTLEEFTGARRDEYETARKRIGITREAVWHQETPNGTVAVVYLEADDIGAAMQGIASSQEPFDVWFRERMKEIHGIDLGEPASPPEQIADLRP